MKTTFRFSVVIGALACALQAGCVVPPAKSLPPRAAFPAANEKLFLSPAIDSSSLMALSGWPSEAALQAPLLSALKKLDSNMLVEFRRCEKFGLYELVDDSLKSSISVTFAIGHFTFAKDTLTMPVRMTVSKPTLKKMFYRTLSGRGIYRAKTPAKSQFHHLYALITDFCRNFPYVKAAEVFYRPAQEPRPAAVQKAAP